MKRSVLVFKIQIYETKQKENSVLKPNSTVLNSRNLEFREMLQPCSAEYSALHALPTITLDRLASPSFAVTSTCFRNFCLQEFSGVTWCFNFVLERQFQKKNHTQIHIAKIQLIHVISVKMVSINSAIFKVNIISTETKLPQKCLKSNCRSQVDHFCGLCSGGEKQLFALQ